MAQLPLDERVQSEFGNVLAASEEVHPGLMEHARNQARAWVLDGKSAGNRSLKAELRKTADLLRQIQKDTARGGGATAMQESVQLLLASGRLLLRSACLDAEDSLEGE
ncbi:MAG TPA: hypothetical protein VII25_04755, partial [Candidatus Acidoferrum sp.]